MKLTYIKQGSEPVGDAGDQYTGLDRFGRVVDQRWIKNNGAALERVDYGYSRAGNRQWRWNRVAASGQDEYYSYDGLYQVRDLQRGTLNSTKTAISGTPTWEEDFTYDPIGNWNAYLTKVSGVTDLDQERTHNEANETTEIDGSAATVAHDPAGNMVVVPQISDWGSTNGLKWDAWNRLVEVAEGETTIAQYRYDGLTRRATKATDATRHYYYSDQWQIMEERVDEAATADRQFVWGQRYLDDLVLRDRGEERLYVLHDYFHPTAVVSPNGTVLERYGYDAFGLSRVMTAGFNPLGSSNYDWETRYAAYRWDAETGFYQVRYRYLHPTLGRWLSRDPVGEASELNLFQYASNTPENRLDVFGLKATLDPGKITGPDRILALYKTFPESVQYTYSTSVTGNKVWKVYGKLRIIGSNSGDSVSISPTGVSTAENDFSIKVYWCSVIHTLKYSELKITVVKPARIFRNEIHPGRGGLGGTTFSAQFLWYVVDQFNKPLVGATVTESVTQLGSSGMTRSGTNPGAGPTNTSGAVQDTYYAVFQNRLGWREIRQSFTIGDWVSGNVDTRWDFSEEPISSASTTFR